MPAVITLQRVAMLGLSAASGLVRVGDELVVIADDELVLHRYALDGSPRGELRLFGGELPADPNARKQAKPDLEALAELPGQRLLALGSCSKAQRERGVLVHADEVAVVDLSPLMPGLRERFDRVNIEGASVLGPHLLLLTRRTGKRGRNAIVRLDLARALASLESATPCLEAATIVDIVDVELGDARGVPYGFTDASPWHGGLLFSAAAEDTDDPVDDGLCVGSIVGRLDARGHVLQRWPVTPGAKLEGIAMGEHDDLFAVADADDRGVPAPLYHATLPAG